MLSERLTLRLIISFVFIVTGCDGKFLSKNFESSQEQSSRLNTSDLRVTLPQINHIPQVGMFSWDFRIQSVHGGVRVFRPEALQTENGIPNFRSSAPYSDIVVYQESTLPAPIGTYPCIFNADKTLPAACHDPALEKALLWGTEAYEPSGTGFMVPDPRFKENPFRSNCDGTANSNGPCETYKIISLQLRGHMLDPNTRAPVFPGNRSGITYGYGTIVVERPKTIDARIVIARPDEFPGEATTDRRYRQLRTQSGAHIPAFEVSITADGRLIVFNSAGPERFPGDENLGINTRLTYIWNQTSSADGIPRFRETGWSTPRSITSMHLERDTLVDGVRFDVRFPLAKQRLRRADGSFFDYGSNFNGAYHWISLDGSELFLPQSLGGCFQVPCPGVSGAINIRGSSFTAALSVIGPWTGWAIRHLDGPINPDRNGNHPNYETIRVGPMSPGSLGSMWSPFNQVSSSVVPHTEAKKVYPILCAGHEGGLNGYQEISFDEHEDGDYFLFLPMNEMLTHRIRRDDSTTIGRTIESGYDNTRTPDISGRFNSAVLNTWAKFPADLALLRYGYSTAGRLGDNNPGIVGRAIFFGERGAVTVSPRSAAYDGPGVVPLVEDLAELARNMTLQIFVKRLSTSPAPSITHNLIGSAGNFSLQLLSNGRLRGTVVTGGAGRTIETPTLAVPLDQWTHVALVYQSGGANNGRLALYVNGEQQAELLGIGSGTISFAASPVIIGPNATALTPGLAETEPVLLLDEVAISRVARNSSEIRKAAYKNVNLQNFAWNFELPLGLTSAALKLQGPAPSANEIALGKKLFFDKRLSSDRSVSCQSCHQTNNAFADSAAVSRGVASQNGTRNSQTAINRAFSVHQFWDGRAATLKDQVLDPIKNPVEMNLPIDASSGSSDNAVNRLNAIPGYRQLFTQIYGGVADRDRLATALAAYVNSLMSGNSRADEYEEALRTQTGNLNALNEREIQGRALFFGKARCVACHSGPNFTDEDFHHTGIADPTPDLGLGGPLASGRASQIGKFKTPTLRDIALTGPYFHHGRVGNLTEVVRLYNEGAPTVANKSVEIRPLGLTIIEREQLVSYLESLTGRSLDLSQPTLPPDDGTVELHTVTANGCTISAAANNCNFNFNVSSNPPVSTSVIRIVHVISGTVIGDVCPNGSTTCSYSAIRSMQAGEYSATLLRTPTATTSLASTRFTLTIQSNTSPSGDITSATGCQISSGMTGCYVNFAFTTANAPNAGVRARLSSQTLSQSVLACTTSPCSNPTGTVGDYILTLHVNGSDFNSTVLDTATVSVTQQGTTPTGDITSAVGCEIPYGGTSCNAVITATASNAPNAGIRARLSSQSLNQSVLFCSSPTCTVPATLAGTFTLSLHVNGADFNSAILDTASVTITQQVPVGDITSANGCEIPYGGTSCNVTMTATANVGTAGIRARASNLPVSSSILVCTNSSCSIPVSTVGTYILTLHTNRDDFNSTILDTATVTVTQQPPPTPTGDITSAVGCEIPYGGTSCIARITATASNAPNAGIRARLSSQALSQSVLFCTSPSCTVSATGAGTFTLTLHVNGSDYNSAVLDTATVTITQQVPTGDITSANGCEIPYGGTSCNVTMTATANVSTAGIRARLSNLGVDQSILVCANSSCSISVPIVGTYTLTLHANRDDINSPILDTATVTVTQQPPPAPTGDITSASGCTISTGSTSCNVTMTATANRATAGIRARLSTVGVDQSVLVCASPSCTISVSTAGTYTLTLHINRDDYDSEILDTETVSVRTNFFAPIGNVDRADSVALAGWAGDQDNSDVAIQYGVVVDNEASARLIGTANLYRSDVGAHGFHIANPVSTLGLTPGTHNLKLYIRDINSAGMEEGVRLLWELNFTVP